MVIADQLSFSVNCIGPLTANQQKQTEELSWFTVFKDDMRILIKQKAIIK